MIIFKKITWKNFLSTGNVANSIELDKHNSTLITGRNGEGKSTILCALTFALFGKPFRNISKGQLVNSINKKNCLVEIEFSVNGHDYTVRRGIKPNIFEIMQGGVLINQDAALKDYQKVLEQQILKLNYKTFTQVVILGSATFVPFMQLSTSARREVIEDILDIKVFSIMNQLLKEKAVSIKDELAKVESEISSHKVKIQSQKKLIETLESNRQNVIAGLKAKIDFNTSQINQSNQTIVELNDQMSELRSKSVQDQINDAVTAANRMKVKISTNINTCQDTINFFHDNTTCPTCSQHIDESYKEHALNTINKEIEAHQEKLNKLNDTLVVMEAKLSEAKEITNAIRDLSINISTETSKIALLTEQNTSLSTEMQTETDNNTNLSEEKQKMRGYAEEAIRLVEDKTKLLDTRQLYEVASALLKDTGIKTAIIREYLPVMNKLINKYLGAMDFFVSFELDESFQEGIKSRGRDEFTYASFSEGEKRRLDLAILFTWRQIAKMKNSVNCNIMILDEILDGALDGAGIDYFLSIMNQFGEHTNVFVISHKVDQMIERFDNVVRVEKKNDFSMIT
jgi:DNA repair exonuclease SbcCD ATPase subunit